jgi:hypothetical protein
MDYRVASDYARAAIAVLDYIEPCSLSSREQNSNSGINGLQNSNNSGEEVDRRFLLYVLSGRSCAVGARKNPAPTAGE